MQTGEALTIKADLGCEIVVRTRSKYRSVLTAAAFGNVAGQIASSFEVLLHDDPQVLSSDRGSPRTAREHQAAMGRLVRQRIELDRQAVQFFPRTKTL